MDIIGDIFYFIILVCLFGSVIFGTNKVLKKLGLVKPQPNENTRGNLFLLIFKEREVFLKAVITIGVLTLVWFLDGLIVSSLGLPQNLGLPSIFTVNQLLISLPTQIMGGSSGQPNHGLIILGLAPFFSAALLIQILSAFVPFLRTLLFGGENGRRKILYLTYALTAGIAFSLAFMLSAIAFPQSVWLVVTIQLGVTLLYVVLANFVNRYGLGNGFAIITAGFILKEIPETLFPYLHSSIIAFTVLFLLIVALFVRIIFNITTRVYPIELQHKNTGQKFTIPFRPTWLGTEPASWAATLLLLPITLDTLFGTAPTFNQYDQGVAVIYSPMHELIQVLTSGSFGTLISLIFIAALTFLYRHLVFKTSYLKELMSRHDIAGHEDDERKWKTGLFKTLLVTTSCLSILLTLRYLLVTDLDIPFIVAKLFSSVGLIILVGVFCDLRNQLAFFRSRSLSGIPKWKLSYKAFDEIEAEIKKSCSEMEGIPALVEPLRFTWGMPIRTVVDEYRIYVPYDEKSKIS